MLSVADEGRRFFGGADWDESVDGGFSTMDKRYGSF